VRGHWSVENNLHWQLDVSFREDERRIRHGHGASRQVSYAKIGSRSDQRPAPAVRAAPKIGRNDPCPCGSGRKHKKCCGRASSMK
jgi:preprotein translocase subunit SecA